MDAWKLVLAGILIIYLVIASAVSLTVRYLAEAPQPRLGQRENGRSEIILSVRSECLIPQISVTGLGMAASMNDFAADDIARWSDFSAPDENASYVLMRPCEDFGG